VRFCTVKQMMNQMGMLEALVLLIVTTRKIPRIVIGYLQLAVLESKYTAFYLSQVGRLVTNSEILRISKAFRS
jgi:hypothetical protein